MPRQIFSITQFDGIVSAETGRRTDAVAAAWSKNLDPLSFEGRQGETTVHATTVGSDYAWLQREDDKRDLIWATSAAIKATKDWENSPGAASSLLTVASTRRSLTTQNRSVRIGLGPTEDAQWVGWVKDGQFGEAAPTSMVITDAKLTSGNNLDYYSKVVTTTGTKHYAVIEGGTIVVRVDATGELMRTKHPYEDTRSIAVDANMERLFVLHRRSDAYYLDELDPDDLHAIMSWPISVTGIGAGHSISDITCSETKMWFQVSKDDDTAMTNGTANLFVVALPAAGAYSTLTLTNVSVTYNKSSTQKGHWDGTGGTYASWKPARQGICGDLIEDWCYLLLIDPPNIRHEDASTFTPTDTMIVMVEDDHQAYYPLNSNGSYICFAMAGSTTDSKITMSRASTATAFRWYISNGSGTSLSMCEAGGGYYTQTRGGDSVSDASANNKSVSASLSYPNYGAGSLFCYATAEIADTDSVVAVSGAYIPRLSRFTVDYLDNTFSAITTLAKGTVGLQVVAGTTTGNLDSAKRYFYAVALEYDGYQSSALSPATRAPVTASDEDMIITISLQNLVDKTTPTRTSVFENERITAVILYRAEGPSTSSLVPSSMFTKVARLSLNDATWPIGSPTGANDRVCVVGDNGVVGPTYEAETGIGETMRSVSLNYSLSCVNGMELFVADAANADTEDTSHILFRSKSGRHDMFNWATDYVVLPFRPVALASWGGRVFAFDKNQCAIVEPTAMVIEGVYEGVGALDQYGVLSTQGALFVANANGVYVYAGRNFEKLSDGIESLPELVTSEYAWEDLGHTDFNPHLVWDGRFERLCVVVSATTGVARVFVLSIREKRWDYWTLTINGFTGVFTDAEGIPYVVDADGARSLATSATRLSWSWWSQDLDFDSPAIPKNVNLVRAIGPSPLTVALSRDGGAYASILQPGTDLTAGTRPFQRLSVKILGTDTQSCESLTIVYRVRGLR
jgi:hypothetical protein